MSVKRTILKYEILSFLFIIIIGSLLHFVFEWSGGSKIVAYFTAVNESVWEHLKLAFFPALFFSVIEFSFVKKYAKNYFLGKVIGFYIMTITIVALFYIYLFIFKEHSLVWDIFTFIFAVFLGVYITYKFLTKPKDFGKNYKIISIIFF